MSVYLSKEGCRLVPLFVFIFIFVPSLLKAENKLFVVPSMLSVVVSFESDKLINRELLENIPYIGNFSDLGKGESAGLILFSHLLVNLLHKRAIDFEKQAILALTLAGVTSIMLKYIFHRTRPNTGKNVFLGPDFSTENLSFPSGHTQIAFTLAGVMTEKYGKPAFFYTLSCLVGAARIKKGMHYFSDVVMGAITGYFISKLSLNKKPVPQIYIYTSKKDVRFLYLIK